MDLPHRTSAPRIQPLEVADWDPALREQMLGKRPAEMGEAEASVFNIFKTLANHPELAGRFARWGGADSVPFLAESAGQGTGDPAHRLALPCPV